MLLRKTQISELHCQIEKLSPKHRKHYSVFCWASQIPTKGKKTSSAKSWASNASASLFWSSTPYSCRTSWLDSLIEITGEGARRGWFLFSVSKWRSVFCEKSHRNGCPSSSAWYRSKRGMPEASQTSQTLWRPQVCTAADTGAGAISIIGSLKRSYISMSILLSTFICEV